MTLCQDRVDVDAGQLYQLASGRRVVVLDAIRGDVGNWGCAYVDDDETPMHPGAGLCNRMSLTAKFLCEWATRL